MADQGAQNLGRFAPLQIVFPWPRGTPFPREEDRVMLANAPVASRRVPYHTADRITPPSDLFRSGLYLVDIFPKPPFSLQVPPWVWETRLEKSSPGCVL